MIFLKLDNLIEIHALVIDATAGSRGIRDLGRLEAAIATQHQNVFGEELYPNTVSKAAAVIRGIVADHPFVDGNKRTAMLNGLTILSLNQISFKFGLGEIENYAVEIATKHIDTPAIAKWLESHITRK